MSCDFDDTMPIELGDLEPLSEHELKNLLYHFKKENLERGFNAEDKIYEFLRQKYPIVLNFRFPKELTNKISAYANKTKDYTILKYFREMLAIKFDFLAGDGRPESLIAVDAKGKPDSKWLYWGCGANLTQYDVCVEISRVMPFFLYVWVENQDKIYVHKVRNPKANPKYELSTNGESYMIPENELKEA